MVTNATHLQSGLSDQDGAKIDDSHPPPPSMSVERLSDLDSIELPSQGYEGAVEKAYRRKG